LVIELAGKAAYVTKNTLAVV